MTTFPHHFARIGPMPEAMCFARKWLADQRPNKTATRIGGALHALDFSDFSEHPRNFGWSLWHKTECPVAGVPCLALVRPPPEHDLQSPLVVAPGRNAGATACVITCDNWLTDGVSEITWLTQSSHCTLMPSFSLMPLKTTSMAWMIRSCGFALQYTINSCSASLPLRISM
jgi:hypothetical protein